MENLQNKIIFKQNNEQFTQDELMEADATISKHGAFESSLVLSMNKDAQCTTIQ